MSWGLVVVLTLVLSPVIVLGLMWLGSVLFSDDDGHAERARRHDEREAAEEARQARLRRRRVQYQQHQEHRRSVASLAAGGAAAGAVGALAFHEESPLDEDEKWRPIGSDPFPEMMEMSSVFDDGPCGSINPANGLPMVGCVDVEGNPYGTDSSHFSDMDNGSSFDAVSDAGIDAFDSSYSGCDWSDSSCSSGESWGD